MNRKLPQWLLWVVGLVGIFFLIGGIYLEWFQASWLNNHPITTNLIASVISFSTASLVVGVGVNALSDRIAYQAAKAKEDDADRRLVYGLAEIASRAISLLPEGHILRDTEQKDYKWIIAVFGALDQIDLSNPEEFGYLCRLCDYVMHNDIKPYATDYLAPRGDVDRLVIRDMEDCLIQTWKFYIHRTDGSAGNEVEALEIARSNLAVYGRMMTEFLQKAIKES